MTPAFKLNPFSEPLAVPRVLMSKRNWIGWRAVPDFDLDGKLKPKPKKLPICINTEGPDGYTLPENHVSYDEAVAAIGRLKLSGVGFVLTPNCGVFGGDLDGCRDPATGVIAPRQQAIIDKRETYFEISPSGCGVRFWALTDVPLRDAITEAGIELYSSGRYLTFTGDHIAGTPWEIGRAPFTVSTLMQWAADIKATRLAAAAAAAGQAGAGSSAPDPDAALKRKAYQHTPMGKINEAALKGLDKWVPELFPTAEHQPGTGAWRVKSADLGRGLQEDLSLSPAGIVDWGVHDLGDAREGKRTAIDVVMEWSDAVPKMDAADAAEWLGDRLGIPFEPGSGSSQGPDPDEPKLVPLPFIVGKILPPREWLVHSGWIPMKKVTLLQGDGGDGKTLLMHQLQASCATGLPWIGLNVEPCASAGIYTEDDDEDVDERQAAIDASYGVSCCTAGPHEMHRFPRADANNELVVFDRARRPVLTKFYERVVEACLDAGARLLVLDVAVDLFGGNEIVRPEVRALFRPLGRLARQMKGAVVMTTHVSQSGIRTDGGHSASTDWSNASRSRLYLNRPKDDQGNFLDPDARVLTRKKANYAALGDTVALRWSRGVLVPDGPGAAARAFRRPVEDVFMSILDAVTKEKQVVSHKVRAGNYAPVVFTRRSPSERDGYGRADFERAMQVLLRARTIVIEPYGKESKGTEKLARNAL